MPQTENFSPPGYPIRGKSTESTTSSVTQEDISLSETANILFMHDGILLKHATAEFITEINTSGSLSLVEYSPSKRLSIEWKPNDNILITDDESHDQDDWSLVDTISKRQRTVSESRAFNVKCESLSTKPKCFRTNLDELRSIEVMAKGQAIRLIKSSDGCTHSEYFFQNGNADIFVRSLQQLHILDTNQNNKREFIILNIEAQKLKKTFAELNLGDIKRSSVSSSSWLPNKVVDFLVKFPDYVAPPNNVRSPVKSDEYEVLEDDEKSETDNNECEKNRNDLENETKKLKLKFHLPERKIISRGSPLTEKQWREFQTEDGRISDPTRIKEAIFRGGIENQLRCEVWKYLLNYYHWDDTTVERDARRKKKNDEYYKMKAQWLSMSIQQERNFTGYRDRKCQIEKDVKRTDRSQDFFAGEENTNLVLLQDILMTYVMYNFDLGYVQGMSDLLAPILSIIRNEVDSFWCFVGFMDLVFTNFDIDQAGMKQQLSRMNILIKYCNNELYEYLKEHGSDNMYCCFRWILVWYKREFSQTDILQLWECLWTQLPCPNFHLLFGIAILDQEKDKIIGNEFEFNEILKHVNELSNNIDLQKTLQLSEAIYNQIKESKCLTNQIRAIIGEELNADEFDGIGDGSELIDKKEFEESFADIVRDLTPDELLLRQHKFEEACDQSMYLTFL